MLPVNPKIDLVFKKIFGVEKNKDLLISLINSIVPADEQVADVLLKNPYNELNFLNDKLSVLDIKAVDHNGRLYDIEIQLAGYDFYGKRALFYWAELFASQLKSGKRYDSLCKTISISFLDFELFNDKRCFRRICLKDFDTNQFYSQLDCEDLYFIEMKKFENKLENIKTALERWVAFLNNASLLPKDLQKNVPESEQKLLEKAAEVATQMGFSEIEQEYYFAHQKFIYDQEAIFAVKMSKVLAEAELKKAEAVAKAELEAELKKIKAVKETEENLVKKLFAKGNKIEEIAALLDISVNKINEILKN